VQEKRASQAARWSIGRCRPAVADFGRRFRGQVASLVGGWRLHQDTGLIVAVEPAEGREALIWLIRVLADEWYVRYLRTHTDAAAGYDAGAGFLSSAMGESEKSSIAGMRRLEPHETFFDAQRRNRRATWRMTAVCVVAVVLMGVPLTLILTPIIYAAGLLFAGLMDNFIPLTPKFRRESGALVMSALRAADLLFKHKPVDARTLMLGAFALVTPGVVLSFALWIFILQVSRRTGVSAFLRLNTREPDPGRYKELQLKNVLEEMALAARLPQPRAIIIDSPSANAAALGTSANDAHLAISSGLLDALEREEFEAVIAHLIASIGNGDLSIAFTVNSIFETCGLLVTLINAPFEREARRTLWRLGRFRAKFARDATSGAEEDQLLDAILTRDIDSFEGGVDRFFSDSAANARLSRRILRFLLFPVFLTNVSIQLTLWFFLDLLLGPALALLWRARRYLADAGAVQFTRDPDGLASALQKLNVSGGGPAGGLWASHLFFVAPDRRDRMTEGRGGEQSAERFAALTRLSDQQANQMLAGLALNPADLDAARHGDKEAVARLRALIASAQTTECGVAATESRYGSESRSLLSFHPPLKRRLARLERMGAHTTLPGGNRGFRTFAILLSVVLGPLVLLLAGLFLLLIAAMIMFNLLILVLWLAIIHAAFGFVTG
jgi:Zn-dependent protease with chaperone function